MRLFRFPSLLLAILIPFAASFRLIAQQSFPVAAPSDERPGIFALTNATIYTDYKTRMEGAILLIRDGKVVSVGTKVLIPAGAVMMDCSGLNIYPAFIDLYATDFGLSAPKPGTSGSGRNAPPQPYTSSTAPTSWNEALHPEFNAADNLDLGDEKAADEWRKLGFASLLTHRADGISRGTGALVTLSDKRVQERLMRSMASHHLSFSKGSSKQNYPSSLMGCIALIRQTMYDAQWYAATGAPLEYNSSLKACNETAALPQIFEAGDKLDILRIAAIGKEFNTRYIVKTAGDEYQRINEVKATGQALIVSLNFPEKYDVTDPYNAQQITLRELKHWEMAPSNPARLEAAGIPFALSTADLKDKSKFMEQLRKAVNYGLSEETALKALTWQPAQMLGCSDIIGTLAPGKMASFIVASGDIFDKNTKILQTWSDGQKFEYLDYTAVIPAEIQGEYQLAPEKSKIMRLFLSAGKTGPEAYILQADSSKIKVKCQIKNENIILSFTEDTSAQQMTTLSGALVRQAGQMTTATGRGMNPDGRTFNWTMQQLNIAEIKPTRQSPEKRPETGAVVYPFEAFGTTELTKTENVLFRNATVWTSEKDGILPNMDVLIVNGKIAKIGSKLPAQDNAIIIDATGKHLTAGIIDEHSHIATRSVNEGTQESSAEVRIGDVLDSESNDIYHQLAGGVTSSHILHGSANPIGGQTQLIKLRWGAAPEQLKFAEWPGFIKFALGENVKQSNWGDNNRTRYPQTRMGVEQVYMDYFTRAQEYAALRKSGKNFRRDLDLDALSEIIDGKRFITCHSYVQSEITMLMRVAEHFHFRVNTFTHILEGYKVADKMAEHGAGGSTFSDWWAYKMEVNQAIPYNAAMMHRQGVVVAINSDDAEMARRLNQEAAKVIKYGGVSEQEAWNMVTINPAKLLHVDNKVGSIKAGKDADLVLWDNNPLSVYARPIATWVDGCRYFDQAKDTAMREDVRKERARIIQKMLADGEGGPGKNRPGRPREHFHCDSEEEGEE